MAKALTCKRGHDTSFPEARTPQSMCRKCEKFIRTRNPQTQLAYEASYARQVSRYSQYKKRLRIRIENKKKRLEEYAEEIRYRNAESADF